MALLELGLGVVARAGTDGSYFVDGHRGAGIIAAELFSERLEARARARLHRLVRESLVGAVSQAVAEPFPVEETPDPDALSEVLAALKASMSELREVGHSVIVGALALRAFQRAPHLLTQSRAEGVAATLCGFPAWPTRDDNDGVLRGDIEAEAAALAPAFAQARGAAFAALVLREYVQLLALWEGKGQGFSGHMLTYGHAVLDLERLGYPTLFELSKPAFCQYCAVCRRGPEQDGPDYHEPAAESYPHAHLGPTDAAYWERRVALDIGHGIKYPYALMALLDDVTSDAEGDALRRECLSSWWRLSPLPPPASSAHL
eukprot:COSAG06_NODE_237_length_19433_cov_92.613961_18_plen_317_part_00